jgi:hypothetical protein
VIVKMSQEVSLTKSTVPVAWFVTALLTVGGGFYWMADLNARVNSMEAVVRELVAQGTISGNRLTRIEAMIENLTEDVGKIVNRYESGFSTRPPFNSLPADR